MSEINLELDAKSYWKGISDVKGVVNQASDKSRERIVREYLSRYVDDEAAAIEEVSYRRGKIDWLAEELENYKSYQLDAVARTVFGKSYNDLSDENQSIVDKTLDIVQGA